MITPPNAELLNGYFTHDHTNRFIENLRRFEMARRILNHAAVLTDEQLEALTPVLESETPLLDTLLQYAVLVRKAQVEELDTEAGHVPVVPTVDITNLIVAHTTGTGKTTIDIRACDKNRFCLRRVWDAKNIRHDFNLQDPAVSPGRNEAFALIVMEQYAHDNPRRAETLGPEFLLAEALEDMGISGVTSPNPERQGQPIDAEDWAGIVDRGAQVLARVGSIMSFDAYPPIQEVVARKRAEAEAAKGEEGNGMV